MGHVTHKAPAPPSFADLFTPKLLTVWREGYTLADLKTDVMSGLTVAVVALPLSMAIAIASGAKPEQGLYTAIVGGFLISALGGSRFQIGGPAGAFIVLVAQTISQYGYSGFLMATIMAGCLLLLIGYLRLGMYVKYIPHPVIIGFTAGIAITIFSGVIHDLFGLTLAHEPGPLWPKLQALFAARDTFTPSAVAISGLTLAIIVGLRHFAPRLPGFLIAVCVSGLLTWGFHLSLATIGSRFGSLPSTLPMPRIPDVPPSQWIGLIVPAMQIAFLGGVESLLSAVVADGMSGRRHRSNCELVAQGYANIVSALFGGLCATGTVARTATNVRAGARGPISGILHALFVLIFLVVAAPLASYIPLAALAAVLAFVCWNMAERSEFAAILRNDRSDAVVLLATFLLTIFVGLAEGVAVGITLGALIFMHRMAQIVDVGAGAFFTKDDEADQTGNGQDSENTDKDVLVYRITGPFFFGAVTSVLSALERIGQMPKAFIIDLSAVPLIDASAAHALANFARRAKRDGAHFIVSGASSPVLRVLLRNGLSRDEAHYVTDLDKARAQATRHAQAPQINPNQAM